MKKFFILITLLYSFNSKEIEYQDELMISEEKILFNKLNNNTNIIMNRQEVIFRDYSILCFITLFLGCFITLYGASYNFFLIFEITFFLYYTISIFFKNDSNLNRNLLFVLLFSFISGVLLYIAHKSYLTTNLTKKKEIIKKICYGLIAGCFFNQIIFHFIFEFNPEYENNTLYYILYPIFILIIGCLNIFLPENKALIPCSIFSGFLLIQLSVDRLYKFLDLSKGEKILDIIYFIIILILGFIFQLYHLRRKENEVPDVIYKITYKKNNMDISMQDMTPKNPNETVEMVQKSDKSLDVTDVDNQDNQIDDQDD